MRRDAYIMAGTKPEEMTGSARGQVVEPIGRVDKLAMQSSQKGSALILALLILVVLTVIGITGANQAFLQERMAGNSKQQTDALFAADSGVSSVVGDEDLFQSLFPSGSGCGPNDYDWVGSKSEPLLVSESQSSAVFVVQLLCGDDGILYVQSTGRAGGSERSVLVQLDADGESAGAFGLSAITIAGLLEEDPFGEWEGGMPNSRMNVDGSSPLDDDDRPAVTFDERSSYEHVLADIEEKGREDEYIGGLGYGDLGYPFGDPQDMSDFVSLIASEAHHVEEGNASTQGQGPGFDLGSSTDRKVNVIEGDFEMRNNASGAGILVVKGDFKMQGTPDFDGLILALGGSASIGGGGGPDAGMQGSLFVANLEDGEEGPEYGQSNIEFSGGGGSPFEYNPESLEEAFDLIGWDYHEDVGAGTRDDADQRTITENSTNASAISWRPVD